ncbi:MAG TPA: DUF3071 domain-containing protein, partial [Tessaracoccus flavescens]|nr:DUF3071 domain-containing protein [Tessaracoccus flavescens]
MVHVLCSTRTSASARGVVTAGKLCENKRAVTRYLMANSLTPREIQARIRSGASVADVAAEAGTDVERIEAFAGPVMAEREHIAAVAQTATVRQRGEAGSHRRLGDLIERRLSSRGLDASEIVWDA